MYARDSALSNSDWKVEAQKRANRITLDGDEQVEAETLAASNPGKFPNVGKRRMFSPLAPTRMYWDGWLLIIMLYVSLVTPFQIAFFDTADVFEGDLTHRILFVLDRVVDTSFAIDFVLSFFTGIFVASSGRWLVTHAQVARQYATTWMALDVVSMLPIDQMVPRRSASAASKPILKLLRLVRLFKLLRLVRGVRIIKRWQASSTIPYAPQAMILSVLSVGLAAHWSACLYVITAVIEGCCAPPGAPPPSEPASNWIERRWADGRPPTPNLYVAAFHW